MPSDPKNNPELVKGQLALTTIPTGAIQGPTPKDVNLDFLDVVILADGSLGINLNPLPPERAFARMLGAKTLLAQFLPEE